MGRPLAPTPRLIPVPAEQAVAGKARHIQQGFRMTRTLTLETAADSVCLTSDAADHASGWRYMTGEIIGIHGVRSARVGCYRLAEDGHAYVHQGTVSLHVRDGQEWMPLPELHCRAQAELRADEDAAVLNEIIASL